MQNDYQRVDVAHKVGLKSGIFVPILIQNVTVAVLEFYSDKRLEPDPNLIDTLSQIGMQLGRVIERKRAEISLHESAQRFRTIANAAPIPLIITRVTDGEILFANPASTVIFGIPVDEFIEMKSPDIFVDRQERQQLVEKIAEQGFLEGYEVRIKSVENSNIFWVSATIKPIIFEGEDTLFSTFIDITDKTLTQAALEQSETRFRSAFQFSFIGRTINLLDGQFIWANQAFCAIIGYNEGQLLEQTWMDIVHPDYIAPIYQRVESLLSGDKVAFDVELQVITCTGDLRWISLGVVLVKDAHDAPMHLVADIIDIHERKIAEADLRNRKNELELSLRAAGAGVWSWDLTSNQLVWDEYTEQLYGEEVGMFDGTYDFWKRHLHPDDVVEAERAIQNALSDIASFNEEFRIIWPDGTERYLLGQAMVLRDDDVGELSLSSQSGELRCRCFVSRDIMKPIQDAR